MRYVTVTSGRLTGADLIKKAEAHTAKACVEIVRNWLGFFSEKEKEFVWHCLSALAGYNFYKRTPNCSDITAYFKKRLYALQRAAYLKRQFEKDLNRFLAYCCLLAALEDASGIVMEDVWQRMC